MIKLVVSPRTVITWEEFVTTYPAYSIALDGYVKGEPKFNSEGPHANFNHHENVNRLMTRCTAAQVSMALKMGLLDSFKGTEEPCLTIYVNDPDQDVCLSVWLLQNFERLLGTRSEPLINRLINILDMLDTCAGAYPIPPDSRIMREIAWINEPYTRARSEQRLTTMQAGEMENIIISVGQRITDYTVGKCGKVKPDTSYRTIHKGSGWSMVEEYGVEARTAMLGDGIKCFISAHPENNGSFLYSIGKMSPFVPFSLEKLYQALNEADGIAPGTQGWGGGDTIGGSPRKGGSKLNHDEVCAVAEKVWAKSPKKD